MIIRTKDPTFHVTSGEADLASNEVDVQAEQLRETQRHDKAVEAILDIRNPNMNS